MVTNFRGRTYEEKLAEAGMTTLEVRRRRGDLIQAYRVLRQVDEVDPQVWFSTTQTRDGATATRQNRGFMNVERGVATGEIRKNFWSQRVVDPWNSLPDSVKESPSLDTFKNCIDNLLAKERNGQR